MRTERVLLSLALAACLGAGVPAASAAPVDGDAIPMLVKALNPSPDTLPTLAVWQVQKELRVAATFPDIPDFTCDSWCYESAMDCIGIAALDGGRIELKHPAADMDQTQTPGGLAVGDGGIRAGAPAHARIGEFGPAVVHDRPDRQDPGHAKGLQGIGGHGGQTGLTGRLRVSAAVPVA